MRKRNTADLLARASTVRPWLGWLVVVVAPFAALLVSLELEPTLAGISPLPFTVAIVLAAWLGGPLAGLAGTALAVLLDAVTYLPQFQLPDEARRPDHLVMLAGTGLVITAIAVLRARAEARAAGAIRQAEEVLARANVAARRLEALQKLATDLADAESEDRILSALLARSSIALESDRCAVAVLDPEAPGGAREVMALAGSPASAAAVGSSGLALVAAEIVEVARSGVPRFEHGRASRGVPGRAIAAVPMRLCEGPGVLAFWWNSPHPLSVERQAFIAALARAGAAALDRHRMFAAEVEALRRAEAAAGYLNILADAGATLGKRLDYDDLVSRLPGLGLPHLGSVGILDVEERDGPHRHVAVSDPDLAFLRPVLEQHALTVDQMEAAVDALRAGRATVHRLDDAVVAALDRTPEVAAALRRLAPAWLLLLPLTVEGATRGVLTFVRRDERPFDEAEMAVGEELGRRAGRSLENTRLFQQVEDLAALDRRRAAELEAVLGAVEEGFLVADSQGVIRSSNNAAIRVLGGPVATVEELLGRLVDSAGHTPRSLDSQPEELMLRNRPSAWVELASYPVESSSSLVPASMVIACRDVTAFRRGQALREAFLGLLSHELRTPVTTIYAAAAVLMRRGRELDADVADEVLGDIAGEAERLFRLVEDLMVLARFDEGIDLGSQPVLLQHIVPAAVRQEEGRWPAVTFTCDVEPNLVTVAGDETAITQVIRNLLSNAAKYSPVGGHVEVSVWPMGEGVGVSVRDTGPGIDPNEAERIFDPFFRSPSTAGLASGAGIGLYVTRRLVDAMGGRITAGAADGGGSEFTFALPAYSETA